jgi:hypothetical protein
MTCLGLAQGGERIANPDYRGTGRFDDAMKIEFKLARQGHRDTVNFQARRIQFYCDDGSEPRQDMPIIRIPVADDGRTFERTIFQSPGGPGGGQYISNAGETIYWIGGQLVQGGKRAKGFVLITDNPEEPAGGSGLPECTTGGKVPWRASRVRGS